MRILILALLALWPGLSLAECNAPPLTERLSAEDRAELDSYLATQPYAEGIFFHATRGGEELYLLGSMHVPDPRSDAILGKAQPYIDRAAVLLVEMTEAELSDFELSLADNPDLMYITDGPSMIDRLDAAEWAHLSDLLRQLGIPPFMGAKYQPWMTSMALAIPPCLRDQIASDAPGLDQLVERYAASKRIPALALDDTAHLLDLLAGDPLDQQVEEFRMALNGGLFDEDQATGLITLYYQGRALEGAEAARRLASSSMQDPAAFLRIYDRQMTRLLDERNARWMGQITAAARDTPGPVFITVGTMHLNGEAGILYALEQAGFSIRRLPLLPL